MSCSDNHFSYLPRIISLYLLNLCFSWHSWIEKLQLNRKITVINWHVKYPIQQYNKELTFHQILHTGLLHKLQMSLVPRMVSHTKAGSLSVKRQIRLVHKITIISNSFTQIINCGCDKFHNTSRPSDPYCQWF